MSAQDLISKASVFWAPLKYALLILPQADDSDFHLVLHEHLHVYPIADERIGIVSVPVAENMIPDLPDEFAIRSEKSTSGRAMNCPATKREDWKDGEKNET